MSVPQNLLGSIVLSFAFSVEEFRLVARSLGFFGTRSPSAFMRRSTRLRLAFRCSRLRSHAAMRLQPQDGWSHFKARLFQAAGRWRGFPCGHGVCVQPSPIVFFNSIVRLPTASRSLWFSSSRRWRSLSTPPRSKSRDPSSMRISRHL